MEKEEAIQIDRSCRALSARIKEFGGKQRAISRVFSRGSHGQLWALQHQPGLEGGNNRCRMAERRDFPGSPVVKNPPSSAGDVGSIPGWGIQIPHTRSN